jgi:tryptophan synthase beta chain
MLEKQYLNQPDASGHYGPYGGKYVSETLMHALSELEVNYEKL